MLKLANIVHQCSSAKQRTHITFFSLFLLFKVVSSPVWTKYPTCQGLGPNVVVTLIFICNLNTADMCIEEKIKGVHHNHCW